MSTGLNGATSKMVIFTVATTETSNFLIYSILLNKHISDTDSGK